MKEHKIPLFLVYIITLLYLEMIFRFFAVESSITFQCLYILLYILFLSCILTLLSSVFKQKVNIKIHHVMSVLLTIWYGAEIVYKRAFHVYFSFATTFFADQAMGFKDKIISLVCSNIIPVLLILIPVIWIMCNKEKIQYFDYGFKNELKHILNLMLGLGIFYLLFFMSLNCHKNSDNSPYELYTHLNNNALNKETFGALPSTFIEIRKMIFPDDDIDYATVVNSEEEEKTYAKNISDIDFQSLEQNETNSTLKSMDNYFNEKQGTNQNEYTGYFKGKNLILIMAESFNTLGVDEDRTPTLYKLSHSGFYFKQFYSPVILSTIGGEFQELTGLYPDLTTLSKQWRGGTNYFPYGYGKEFSALGYRTYAYHDHTYNFQNRNTYLSSLGFTNFQGCGNGLESRINCNQWPESDMEMMNTTPSDYLGKDGNFMTYYVTVSGHMSYSFKSNAMARKHQDAVDDLPYSEDVRAYMATQIELDQALAELIQKLTDSGELDNTVIALVGDHYPYDISTDHINEAHECDGTIEINRSDFILWNSTMDTKEITKVGGNLDVLPTILNLFGISYDSRLIIGNDLLSDSPGLVIFADHSWVTNEGSYWASTKQFVSNGNIKNQDEYVSHMNQIVNNKINMSKLIMENDYYKKVGA